MIHHGDCLEVMAGMEPDSVDAIVTDPPYGLEFMGKAWDRLWTDPGEQRAEGYVGTDSVARRKTRPVSASLRSPTFVAGTRAQEWHQRWAEAVYRVAKPSAYLLAFGGTRTVHRLTTAIEDAGWIVRDMLVWAYASGFPKSKASLKPAWEPIVMARKPGPLRELAIDACRIGTGGDGRNAGPGGSGFAKGYEQGSGRVPTDLGRWPANVILTDPIFDGGWDGVVGGGTVESGWRNGDRPAGAIGVADSFGAADVTGPHYGDAGTYSRFFLIPKAGRTDREPVIRHEWWDRKPIIPHRHEWWDGTRGQFDPPQCLVCGVARGEGALAAGLSGSAAARPSTMPNNARPVPNGQSRANVHPTVKPTELMRHLVRLVTPTGGTVLDPFLGSGSTAIAAEMEGFDWIGIEKEAEYVAIAEARLNGTQRGLGLPA